MVKSFSEKSLAYSLKKNNRLAGLKVDTHENTGVSQKYFWNPVPHLSNYMQSLKKKGGIEELKNYWNKLLTVVQCTSASSSHFDVQLDNIARIYQKLFIII